MTNNKYNHTNESDDSVGAAFDQVIDKVLLAFKAGASEEEISEVLEKETKSLKSRLVSRGRHILQQIAPKM